MLCLLLFLTIFPLILSIDQLQTGIITATNSSRTTGNDDSPIPARNMVLKESSIPMGEQGCITRENGPECCGKIKKIPFKVNMCVNLTYSSVNETDMLYSFFFKWNGDVFLKGKLINFDEPICAFIPYTKSVLLVCVFFTQMSRVDKKLSGCAYVDVKIVIPTFTTNLGCFGGAKNRALSPQPLMSLVFLLMLYCEILT